MNDNVVTEIKAGAYLTKEGRSYQRTRTNYNHQPSSAVVLILGLLGPIQTRFSIRRAGIFLYIQINVRGEPRY